MLIKIGKMWHIRHLILNQLREDVIIIGFDALALLIQVSDEDGQQILVDFSVILVLLKHGRGIDLVRFLFGAEFDCVLLLQYMHHIIVYFLLRDLTRFGCRRNSHCIIVLMEYYNQ